MIKHVVFFRLHDEAEGKTKLENAQIIRDGLLALRDKIDVLVDETVGINIPNAKNTDHDICLTCTFRTWEDLDAYAKKKRCSGVKPSTTPRADCPLSIAAFCAFWNAWNATCKPP